MAFSLNEKLYLSNKVLMDLSDILSLESIALNGEEGEIHKCSLDGTECILEKKKSIQKAWNKSRAGLIPPPSPIVQIIGNIESNEKLTGTTQLSKIPVERSEFTLMDAQPDPNAEKEEASDELSTKSLASVLLKVKPSLHESNPFAIDEQNAFREILELTKNGTIKTIGGEKLKEIIGWISPKLLVTSVKGVQFSTSPDPKSYLSKDNPFLQFDKDLSKHLPTYPSTNTWEWQHKIASSPYFSSDMKFKKNILPSTKGKPYESDLSQRITDEKDSTADSTTVILKCAPKFMDEINASISNLSLIPGVNSNTSLPTTALSSDEYITEHTKSGYEEESKAEVVNPFEVLEEIKIDKEKEVEVAQEIEIVKEVETNNEQKTVPKPSRSSKKKPSFKRERKKISPKPIPLPGKASTSKVDISQVPSKIGEKIMEIVNTYNDQDEKPDKIDLLLKTLPDPSPNLVEKPMKTSRLKKTRSKTKEVVYPKPRKHKRSPASSSPTPANKTVTFNTNPFKSIELNNVIHNQAPEKRDIIKENILLAKFPVRRRPSLNKFKSQITFNNKMTQTVPALAPVASLSLPITNIPQAKSRITIPSSSTVPARNSVFPIPRPRKFIFKSPYFPNMSILRPNAPNFSFNLQDF